MKYYTENPCNNKLTGNNCQLYIFDLLCFLGILEILKQTYLEIRNSFNEPVMSDLGFLINNLSAFEPLNGDPESFICIELKAGEGTKSWTNYEVSEIFPHLSESQGGGGGLNDINYKMSLHHSKFSRNIESDIGWVSNVFLPTSLSSKLQYKPRLSCNKNVDHSYDITILYYTYDTNGTYCATIYTNYKIDTPIMALQTLLHWLI